MDAERDENPLERSEEGGKGFDASIPAVFRAKVIDHRKGYHM